MLRSDDDTPDEVRISGRAVNFPQNTGRAGATLTIYAIDPQTGQRLDDVETLETVLGEDGAFGPDELDPEQRYEFSLRTPGSDVEHHLYLPPFVADSNFVRL